MLKSGENSIMVPRLPVLYLLLPAVLTLLFLCLVCRPRLSARHFLSLLILLPFGCLDFLCFTFCFLLLIAKLASCLVYRPTLTVRLFRLVFCFCSFLTFSRCTIIEFAEQEAPPFILCNYLLRGLLRIYAISKLELQKA